jgi:thymidylate synthase (FAD)
VKLINQSHEILFFNSDILYFLEKCGRVCYKSQEKITENSSNNFIKNIINSGHESVIEHSQLTVKFITSRAVTHELVRHRLASYSQESQRYVNYNKSGIKFIIPVWADKVIIDILNDKIFYNEILFDIDKNNFVFIDSNCKTIYELSNKELSPVMFIWLKSLYYAEQNYRSLIIKGWRPEQARDVLPNACSTEIVITTNLREWRHIFKLRTSKKAHPMIRDLMSKLLYDIKEKIGVIFDDIIDTD